jgi:hypothetical protein
VEDISLDARIFLSQLEQKKEADPPASPGKRNSVRPDDAQGVRQQRIDFHTDQLSVFMHLDQYHQLLGVIDNYRRRAAAAKRPAEKEGRRTQEGPSAPTRPAPRPAAPASPSPATQTAPAQGENRGWFSWAWDIIAEEEYGHLHHDDDDDVET